MNKAYVFIDESGDLGINTTGASPNFVLCCVVFRREEDIENISSCMRKVKKRLKKNDNYEFKFNKMSKKEKKITLNAVGKLNYSFSAIYLNKKNNKIGTGNKGKFYCILAEELLRKENLKTAKIIIDGGGDKKQNQKIITYLRKLIKIKRNNQYAIEVIIRDSKNSLPIQLADLLAGSISRYFLNKSDSRVYFDIVKRHKKNIWEYK
jgi:hypothetical protein